MRLVAVTALAALLSACGSTSVAPPARLALVYSTQNGNVVVASPRGAHPHGLGLAAQALLAPDGSLVATLRGGGGTAPVLLSTDRTAGAPRPHVAARFGLPQWSRDGIELLAWSPDSRYVALSANRLTGGGEQTELLLVDVATGTVRQIATGDFLGASFAPTLPDRLVYADASVDQLDSGHVALFTANADGSGRRQLTRSGLALDPGWGAKGIVFARLSRVGSPTSSPRYQLWLVQPNGSGLRRLTHITAGPPAADASGSALAVSASGTRVVATLYSAYTTLPVVDVWTVNLARSRPVTRELHFRGAAVTAAGIARNGQTILVSAVEPTGRSALESVHFDGTGLRLLAARGWNPSWNR
ncbi:MAG: hypothetical protein ABSG64_12040 [Solirubrobacteraceae bacterium]